MGKLQQKRSYESISDDAIFKDDNHLNKRSLRCPPPAAAAATREDTSAVQRVLKAVETLYHSGYPSKHKKAKKHKEHKEREAAVLAAAVGTSTSTATNNRHCPDNHLLDYHSLAFYESLVPCCGIWSSKSSISTDIYSL